MANIGPLHAVNSLLKTLAIAAFPQEYKFRSREFKVEERQANQSLPLFILFDVVSRKNFDIGIRINPCFRYYFRGCLCACMYLNKGILI